MITKDMVVESFAEFTGLKIKTIEEYMANGDAYSKDHWNMLNGNDKRDLFHYNSIPLICSYINWHYNIAFSKRLALSQKLKGNVFNYGCGIATECFLNDNKDGIEMYLYEPSHHVEAFLRYLVEKYTIRNIKINCDIRDIKFDTILLIDVLEHVEYPIEILNNMIEKLTPEGKILVRSPFGTDYPGHLNPGMTIELLMSEIKFTRYEVVEV